MTTELNQDNKALVWTLWSDLAAPGADAPPLFAEAMAPNVAWHGHAPLGSLIGPAAVAAQFWAPLMHSFPDLSRTTHIFFGGESNGRRDGDIGQDGRWWVTGTGLFEATFTNDYLSIPASGEAVSIRWGEFCCIEDGAITEVYFLVDMVDLARQAGFDLLPPPTGVDGVYPAPAAADGLLHGAQDQEISQYSREHIWQFIFNGLNAFDESALESMGMADWFDPDVQWYGPGGIGGCLGFHEFETLHQAPWLVAFPDRQVQDLDALFAEGMYSAGPGWSGVLATHTGPYLDQPATGNSIAFNGLDWWKRSGETYIENWVFVDMLHLFAQFGVDLLARIPQAE